MGSILRRDMLALGAVLLVAACDDDVAASSIETVARAAAVDHAAPAPMARIIAISGDVRVRRAGSAGWVEAVAGDPLLPGDSVQTLGDARASVRFERDAATTRLDPGTTIHMPAPDERVTRLTHLSGRLIARVVPGREGSGLEVDLPPGTLVLTATSGPPASRSRRASTSTTRRRTSRWSTVPAACVVRTATRSTSRPSAS